MMRKFVGALVACVVIFIVNVHVAAADDSTLKIQSVDTTAAPRIHLTVQVPPELIDTSLPDKAFSVIEAGHKRSAHVAQLPTEGLSLVLAIDTSGSMRGDALDAAKAAAINFIQKMPAETRIAVIGFGNQPYEVSPFTTEIGALSNAINALQAAGETSLYDAVVTAASRLGNETTQRHELIVLTDGKDTQSTQTLDAASSAIRSANVTVFAVALITADTDVGPLNQLAAPSGQQAVPATDPAALQGIYNAIAQQIASQYALSFDARGTGSIPIKVSVDWNNVRASASTTVNVPAPSSRAPAPQHARQATTSDPVLAQDWVLALGGGLAFIALCTGLVTLARRRTPRTVLAEERAQLRTHQPSQFSEVVDRASRLADRTLERHNKRRALGDALERAGIDMRTGEFTVLVVAVALGVLFFGLLLGGPLVGLGLAAVTVIAFRVAVTMRADRRRTRFAEQLGDTLQLLSSNLRTGHGLLQSVDTVAAESETPTQEEFRRIVIETRLGQDLNGALDAAAGRVGNDDFEWVVQAIDIHREVGGDLAEVLDNVGETIRDRNSIRRQIRALTAEGRLSAVVLFVLPIALTFIIAVASPAYLNELTGTTVGNILIGVAVGLMILGGFWLRRLTRVVF
jgi:tight adherence protein B